MRSVKSLLAAGAATLISSMAFAADMPIAAPPPMYAPPAPPADFGGWYLRGDVGMTNQSAKRIESALPAGYSKTTEGLGFDSAGLFDLGVGYRFNNWFRADLIGQYRGKSTFTGLDVVTGVGPGAGFVGTDAYHATKSEWLLLANAYVDLGTWWCITPFIGAGVGTARVSVGDFTDSGDSIGAFGQSRSLNYAGSASKWNFAWAAHAGLAYKVNPSLTLELAYSYVDMGNGMTGPSYSFDGVTNTTHAAFQFKDITSHDLKLGVRWNLDSPPVYAPPPLVTKG
jgi:opacity protein-like surface antigen